MREATITENTRSYFTRPLGSRQLRVHCSAEEERTWARGQFRECRECKQKLSRTCFGYNTSSSWPFDRDGFLLRRPECIDCARKSANTKALAIKYAKKQGLPIKAPPRTACQLCSKTDGIVFDHSHSLCKFRGWLCNSCNRSLGVLGDEAEEVVKALMYTCGGNRERFESVVANYLKSLY